MSLRGIRARAGSAAMVFVTAVLAVAAATAGPAYYAAGRVSLERDTFAGAGVLGRGYELVQSGALTIGTAELVANAHLDLGARIQDFEPMVLALEGTAFEPALSAEVPLVWRSGVCANLRHTGRCPTGPGEVLASTSLAAAQRWRVGQDVSFANWGALRITGLYQPPTRPGDYWFDRVTTYFPMEFPPAGTGGRGSAQSQYDALFTPVATLKGATFPAQGSAVVSAVVNEHQSPSELSGLNAAVQRLEEDINLQDIGTVVTTSIPETVGLVRSSWASLEVPVLVVTLQVLGLTWLVMALITAEAAESRGPEVALARLRGYRWGRASAFVLSEPVALAVLAVPAGVLAGWGAANALGHGLFRPGNPSPLPWTAVAAGAAAASGCVLAAAVSSVRVLRRPVLEQWRRAGGRPRSRSWVADAILLTGAAAGLGELFASGAVTSASRDSLGLLAPGLTGLAAAVVASRLLPPVCSRLSKRAAVGPMLGLLQLARRPNAARTTIVLATAAALGSFSLASWSLDRHNFENLASVEVGAPTVLQVSTPAAANLASLVSTADPSGRWATPVEEYTSGGPTTLAVEPRQWAGIASWPAKPAAAVVAALDPPAAPPLVLDADAVRLAFSVESASLPNTILELEVSPLSGGGSEPVQLAVLRPGAGQVVTAPLSGCPCLLDDLTMVPDPALGGFTPLSASVTVVSVAAHSSAGWRTIAAGLTASGRWAAGAAGGGAVAASTGGLVWRVVNVPGDTDPTLEYLDRPAALPALVSGAGRGAGTSSATGLDGRALPVDVVGHVPTIPGAASGAVVVDQAYAERAADLDYPDAEEEVWLAKGCPPSVLARLGRAGVEVLATSKESVVRAAFARQGPGLSVALLVAEAVAAAGLAATGALVGLFLYARRRRYELSALEVTGIRRRSLLVSLVLEQAVLVAFAAAVGVVAALGSATVVLRHLPEVVSVPSTVRLAAFPPLGPVVVWLVAVAAVVLAVSVTGAVVLLRGVSAGILREGQT